MGVRVEERGGLGWGGVGRTEAATVERAAKVFSV